MTTRIYTIAFPDMVVRYQCDRTVQRFRSLSVGRVFIIGEDEEHVYMKTSPLTMTSFIPMNPTVDIDVRENPWCEPMEEVKK
jgi:hypothetical protein